MEKRKRLKTTLISLLAAALVALLAAVFSLGGRFKTSYAYDRLVNLDGNTVFYTSIRGANITHTEAITEGEGEEAKDRYYTLFEITGDQTVSYRQNLAYKWISGMRDEEDKPTGVRGDDGYFSMEISFQKLNFKRYIIRFQSQQFELTKDGKSENYLIFTPSESGEMIEIYASQTLEEKDGNIDGAVKASVTCDKTARINISLARYSNGSYPVLINGSASGLELKNVSENFASYVASGDNAVTPLQFSAQFADSSNEEPAQMVLYSLNGQSFEMHKQSDDEFRIIDTAAPVICFGSTPSYLEYGKSISFNYKVIDVLASNPGARAFYYVLSGEQYQSTDFDYDRTNYKTEDSGSTEGGDGSEKQTSPFTEITSSSDARIVRDANTFIPADLLDSNVYGLVKIYYKLYDVSYSSSSSKKDIVFVDWYAKDDALVNIYGPTLKNDSGKQSDFLKLIDDKPGVTYARSDEESYTLENYKTDVLEFERVYGEKIKAAIDKLEDKKLYAGSDKFYLPAIEWNFADDFFNANDYKYSIYYRANRTGSNTSMSNNSLAMDLNEADVTYRFTILVSDGFSTDMRYPTDEIDSVTGKRVWKTISADDVWDEEFNELLPYFEVDVSYKEATCEDPDNLSQAYVGTNYSGISFNIKGVSDTYTTSYNLYVFDRNAYNRDTGKSLEYDEFIGKVQELFDSADTRKYFTTVKASGELLESDDNYEDFRALNWNAGSQTFTPQSVEDFYVVQLTLTDKRSKISKQNYATVAASVQTTPLKGESDWLENNLASVILFSVAGVCLIAFIVLLIVKPKDKGDIDAVYTEVEGQRKGKKDNNNN